MVYARISSTLHALFYNFHGQSYKTRPDIRKRTAQSDTRNARHIRSRDVFTFAVYDLVGGLIRKVQNELRSKPAVHPCCGEILGEFSHDSVRPRHTPCFRRVEWIPGENQRFCEEKLHFWSNFDVFGIKISKNLALKTLAKNLKSGSENLKP